MLHANDEHSTVSKLIHTNSNGFLIKLIHTSRLEIEYFCNGLLSYILLKVNTECPILELIRLYMYDEMIKI